MFAPAWQAVRRVLCLGAHADDLEIGCGGALLRLAEECADLRVQWVVFSGTAERAREAQDSAAQWLPAGVPVDFVQHDFADSCFPAQWAEIKRAVADLRTGPPPDVIFTHRRDDAHQDHRVLAELAWCTFRDHWILEYEIPKYEGDLGQPNLYVPLSAAQARRKAEQTYAAFPSQQGRAWFTPETFLALARIRGVECQAPQGYAEAFYARKTVV